jgi:membrane protease YdiL (CAAX protease family)
MEDADKKALLAHTVPYGVWWVLKYGLNVPEISEGWQYAIRSIVCLLVFLLFRPWRWYAHLKLKNIPLGIGVGIFIFLVWVVPESRTFGEWMPALQSIYQKYFVGLLWIKREIPTIPPFAPETCGWPLAVVRLCGSAFVIAFIEEFVFRGFLYRAAISGEKFVKLDPGTVDGTMFLLVAVTFALEHNEWLAGFVCGVAYGWLFIQSRDIWATGIAHMTTNLLLGLYVLKSGMYQLW